jgi:F-type H+-transporting ATPase subunit b
VNINWTLVGQMIFFVIFVLFCMKYVWPPITNAMAERAKKIADGLAAADRADKDLELAKEKAAADLKGAKAQAAEIIEQAKKRADQMVEEAKGKAKEEADRVRATAEAEVEQQIAQAKEALRAQVSVLAVAGAEKILESSVDAKVHGDMLDKLAAQL